MWYFGSHGEFVDRSGRVPSPGCHALAEYDPDGFRLLGLVYGGTHALLRDDALQPVVPLSPVAASTVSGGGAEGAELPSVTLHFANLRGEADAELWWADASPYPPTPPTHTHAHPRTPHGHPSTAPDRPGTGPIRYARALQVGRSAGGCAPLRLRGCGRSGVAANLRDARVGGAADGWRREDRPLPGGQHGGQLRRGSRLFWKAKERPGRLMGGVPHRCSFCCPRNAGNGLSLSLSIYIYI